MLGVLLTRDRVPPLDAAGLAGARRLWEQSGLRDYRLSLTTEGSGLARGVFELEVRGAKVASARRNGRPTTGESDAYSVPGLFRLLADELELSKTPQRSYGAPEGYEAHLFARFDPVYGLPRRFRRIVGGANTSVEIAVVDFEPISGAGPGK